MSVCEFLLSGFRTPAQLPESVTVKKRDVKSTSAIRKLAKKKEKKIKEAGRIEPEDVAKPGAEDPAQVQPESWSANPPSASVQSIMEMGFSRQRVEHAINAMGVDAPPPETVVLWLLENDAATALVNEANEPEVPDPPNKGNRGPASLGSDDSVRNLQKVLRIAVGLEKVFNLYLLQCN